MEIIDRKTLWKGKFIKTTLISYRDRRGVVREWEAVGRAEDNRVVVIIPVTRTGELLLVRQYRPAVDSYVIELPAGLVEPDEDDLTAGRRELIEETGYVSDAITPLIEGVMSTGINTEQWRILLASDVREAEEKVRCSHPPDEGESIELIKVPLADVHGALEQYRQRGDTVDLRIYGLLVLARRRLGRR
jgi:ADP-ribose pyrophosphatase